MSHRASLLLAYALISSGAVSAQDILEEPPRPMVTAVRLEQTETVTLDGRLDELVWTRAVPATDFTQRIPQNGAPATERTEVRFGAVETKARCDFNSVEYQ